MYWVEGLQIWIADMDGRDRRIMNNRHDEIVDLTVVHSTHFVYWIQRWWDAEMQYWNIARVKHPAEVYTVITLSKNPIRLRIAGNRMFWLTFGENYVSSCDKLDASHLKTQELRDFNANVTDFLVIPPSANTEDGDENEEEDEDKDTEDLPDDPCTAGSLCSHICVPTPTEYMRCVCPDGYQLLPDGWTCSEFSALNFASSFLISFFT